MSPLISPAFLSPPALVLSGPASDHLLLIFAKKDHRKIRTVTEHVPIPPPPDLMRRGETASSTVPPVEAYSTAKEIIRKKSEKKKKQKDE